MNSSSRQSLQHRKRLREVLDECLHRSSIGQPVDDDALIASHPELMPDLASELRLLRMLEQAGRRAREESGASQGGVNPLRRGAAGRPAILPTILGYRLLDEIHRGGQGVVFRAVQESTKRIVAIKVQREGPWAGAKDRARFEREVEILAGLRHPNIVTIHDKGEAAGATYFVMDYIDGVPLDEHVRKVEKSKSQKVEIAELLGLFVKVCDAVHAAHLRGVIHRDLKPGNILVIGEGGQGIGGSGVQGPRRHTPGTPGPLNPRTPEAEPMILDFGLARLTDDPASIRNPKSEIRNLTMSGQFVGSLPWASPEQVRTGAVDLRTDVYSLGVMLYQMLAGRFPYDVTGPMREVIERIIHAEPARLRKSHEATKPRSHGGSAHRPSVAPSLRGSAAFPIDADLETIVLRAIDKAPERRYQSAGDLARDLRRYLAGEAIEARRDSGWYVLRKTLKRRRGTVGALSAVMVALTFGIIGTLWQAVRASRERDRAAEQALRATETTELLKRMIRSATPEMAQGSSPTVREMLDAASGDLEHDESIHPLVAADTHGTLADAYFSLGEYARAEVHARRALELHAGQQGSRHPDALEAAGDLARILSRLDRDAESVATAKQALDAARADWGPDHSVSINLAIMYAYALGSSPNADPAEVVRWGREGHERCAAVFGADDPRTLQAGSDLGVTLAEAGKLDEAERLFRTTLDARRRDLGEDHPDVLVSLTNLQAILDRRKDLPGGLEIALDILGRADRILGREHPRTCRYALNAALLNARLGRLEAAEPLARRAMVAATRLGPAHHDVLKYRGLLATVLLKLKRMDEAEALVREQYDLCVEHLGAAHPDTLQAVTLQYDLAEAEGRLDQMRHWAEQLRGTEWEEEVFKQLDAAEAAEREKPPEQ